MVINSEQMFVATGLITVGHTTLNTLTKYKMSFINIYEHFEIWNEIIWNQCSKNSLELQNHIYMWCYIRISRYNCFNQSVKKQIQSLKYWNTKLLHFIWLYILNMQVKTIKNPTFRSSKITEKNTVLLLWIWTTL